jgi:ribosomal-protein-serine acetyltransferase
MRPIMLNLPMPIVTPRLILRPPKIGEGAELNTATIESIAELRPWMPWAQTLPSNEQSEEYVRECCVNWILKTNSFIGLPMFIIDKKTKMIAGLVAYHNMVWDVPVLEIGYWMRTQFGNRGYMTEAVNALTRYSVLQLNAKRIEIRCEPTNIRSRKVPERLGYHLEAMLRTNHRNVRGEPSDVCVYVRHDLNGLPELEVRW